MTFNPKIPISVAIIARDAAATIAACIDSLGFADEVVVVIDERSVDESMTIAKSRGCRTFQHVWMGFAKQKQIAVELCHHDWVLILDADERIPKETAEDLSSLRLASDPRVSAYSVLRKNIFHGRWIKGCGWWPDRVTRLVDKTRGCFSDHRVHEHWLANGPIRDLNLIIEHYSFCDYSALIDKLQIYSSLSALQMKEEKRYAQWWTPLSHGAWMFFRNYFLKFGILDGLDGLIISVLTAGGSFMKYAKLRELWLSDKPQAEN